MGGAALDLCYVLDTRVGDSPMRVTGSRPRSIQELTQAMLGCAKNRDTEGAHLDADALLLEAIERLAPYATETTDEGETEELISAWHAVPKWFA